jgi:hypothetical protein
LPGCSQMAAGKRREREDWLDLLKPVLSEAARTRALAPEIYSRLCLGLMRKNQPIISNGSFLLSPNESWANRMNCWFLRVEGSSCEPRRKGLVCSVRARA